MSVGTYPNRDPQLMLDLARDQLSVQLAAGDAADAKLSGLIGWGAGAPGILAAVLALKPASFHGLEIISLALVVVTYSVLAVIVFLALSRKSWNLGPKMDQVWDDHFALTERQLRWETARDLWSYYDDNRPTHDRKMKAVRKALALVMLETAALVIGLILVAAGV